MTDIQPVRDFVRREFLYDPGAELGDEDPLFPEVVDSLGIMEVVEFVERTYDIEVDEDELVVDNLATLAALRSFIDKKRG